MLGPAVSDLQNLLELPTGCGEQNMAKLVPNIVVMEYLKVRHQLFVPLLHSCVQFLLVLSLVDYSFIYIFRFE